jgi:hypothetical protein
VAGFTPELFFRVLRARERFAHNGALKVQRLVGVTNKARIAAGELFAGLWGRRRRRNC